MQKASAPCVVRSIGNNWIGVLGILTDLGFCYLRNFALASRNP